MCACVCSHPLSDSLLNTPAPCMWNSEDNFCQLFLLFPLVVTMSHLFLPCPVLQAPQPMSLWVMLLSSPAALCRSAANAPVFRFSRDQDPGHQALLPARISLGPYLGGFIHHFLKVKTSLQRLKCSVKECGLHHYHLGTKVPMCLPHVVKTRKLITPESQFLDNIWSTKLLINKRTLM